MKRLSPLAVLIALTGCVSTAGHVVMAPVHAVGWGVDKMTTSQAEADRNRGRRDRKAEEKQRRDAKKEAKRQRALEKERERNKSSSSP